MSIGLKNAASTDMVTSVEYVTPETAKHWLTRNVRNRRIRPHKVEMYAKDMKAGDWLLTHQGIGFYADGTLADGQHRLSAIVASGVSVLMNVTRGIRKMSGTGIDIGEGRTEVDLSTSLGIDVPIDVKIVAVAKALQAVSRSSKQSKQESLRFIVRHLSAIRFALSLPSSRESQNAVFRGVLARGFYSVDHSQLRRFAEVVSTGMADGPHESAAVAVRNLVMRDRSVILTGTQRVKFGFKCEAALRAFVAGRRMTKLQETQGHVFLLPGEAKG
jgi:hypothetical protein